MIVSTKHRFIFVHVPKTAGDSVTNALQPFAVPLKRTVWKSIQRRFNLPGTPENIYLRKHDPASAAIRRLGRETYDSFESFAVVRNPFDHAVSHYEFLKQFRIASTAEKIAAMSFCEYLRYRMKPPFWNDTFFARLPNQSYFVADKGKLEVGRLVRFENLAEDFARVTDELGLGAIAIPHVNKTKSKSDKKPYQAYYDAEALELVRELYAEDFSLLDYSTELPDVSA